MKRWFVLLLMTTSLSVQGATISSYVDDEGVRVLTNLTPRPPVKAVKQANFVPIINRLAAEHGVSQELVRAIVKVESNFNPRAVSPKDCKGLMQLHPGTADRFGVRDIFDPAQNIEGGVKYLSFLIEEFGQKLDFVLAAYNAGENAVRRYNGIPPYPETIDYVRKVKSLFSGSMTTGENPHPGKVVRVELPEGQILFTNDLSHIPDGLGLETGE